MGTGEGRRARARATRAIGATRAAVTTEASPLRRWGVGPAHPRRRGPGAGGFTFTELLVAILIISVLSGVILVVVGRVRASAASVSCLANLRTIGEGFRLFAVDHGGRLPEPADQDTSWEEMLTRYIGETGAFRCPSDTEVFPSVGSSYDWRDAGGIESSMAGRAITEVRGDAVLAFETLPGWHAANKMNAVTADGSARSMSEDECLADVFKAVR